MTAEEVWDRQIGLFRKREEVFDLISPVLARLKVSFDKFVAEQNPDEMAMRSFLAGMFTHASATVGAFHDFEASVPGGILGMTKYVDLNGWLREVKRQ